MEENKSWGQPRAGGASRDATTVARWPCRCARPVSCPWQWPPGMGVSGPGRGGHPTPASP